MKSQISSIALLLFVAFVLSGCDRPDAAPVAPPTPPLAVHVVKPARGPITRFVTLPGEIKPYQQAVLYAKVTGYLKTMPVDKGDRVKEGQLLAEIEVPELLADRTRYQAEVEVAQIDYRRLSESQKQTPDLVVPQTVDEARGRLEIAKANLERTDTLLAYAKINAPFSGIITRRWVDPGAFIPAATSGSAAQSAALLTLADFNRVRLQVAVPETDASLVEVDAPIQVSVEGLPGKKFEGKVTRFAYALDDDTKTMLTEIELPNPSLELRPGMYATVRIGLESKTNVLLVPVGAVLNEKAGPALFVAADGKAHKARVQTGFNDGAHMEILSGIKQEQEVILLGKQAPNDGQPITIITSP